MALAALFVFGCSAAASAYQVVQGFAARRFFRRAAMAAARWRPDWRPPVTILKPLKGEGLDLYANLASFCRQDYPRYQIVFGVCRADDPAVAVVERIQRDFPHCDVTLAIGDAPGTNRKVANLVQMMRAARHDVLVLSDADIRVRPDYLRTMVAPLSDPRVGLTTCLYRGRGYFGLPSVLESLYLNTIFVPMVLMAQWVQEFRYAYGASIALRRDALEASGGFAPLADYLADDYLLGNRVHAAGFELVLLPYVVETVLDSVTLADLWRHLLRWARTYRVCQPFNWFLTIITHTTLWGMLAVLASGGSRTGFGLLAAALACRLGSLRYTMGLLREHETRRQLWLVPLSDLGYSALWLVSWFGRQVDWSGQRLRVEPDGRMVPLGPVPVPGTASEVAGRDQLDARRSEGAADLRA